MEIGKSPCPLISIFVPQDSNHPCWYKELPPSPPAVVLTADGNTVSVGNFAGRVTTASPDLGIESDQGRFSSLEPFPLKKSTTAPALNVPDDFPASFQFRSKCENFLHELNNSGFVWITGMVDLVLL